MSKSVLFIDSKVKDYQTLLLGLGDDVEMYLLNTEEDGVLQIADILKGRTELGSIQIISHGSSGALSLGSGFLNNDNLSFYANTLGQIGSALSATGDILLYGCDVAQGDNGLSFIKQLAAITNADVAASDDLTGDSALGGDWQLEVQTGVIETMPINTTDYAGLLTVTATPNTKLYQGHTLGEHANTGAFAVIKADGSVVSWGESYYGGDSRQVAAKLDGTIDVKQIYSTNSAFAALRADGSVVTWGSSTLGGDSSSVATALNGTNDVQDVISIYSNFYAFAALRADGSVVTWGRSDQGGDSSSVVTALNGANDAQDVVNIYSTSNAFAALRADGSVVTWGDSTSGGDSSSVADTLDGTNDAQDVVNIYSTGSAFGALRADGSVVTWGDSTSGGDSSNVTTALSGTNDAQDVVRLYSTGGAFAALRADGSVVTWGYSPSGGDSSSVATALNGTNDAQNVVSIYSTNLAFAALRADGSVVTWGYSTSGGDSSSVATALNGVNDAQDVVRLYSTVGAFAALRADGSVVTWGYSGRGGDSSSVADALDGTNDAQDVVRLYSNDYAFAALRADGSVVTWGYSGRGGDSSSVADALDGTNDVQDVVNIYSNDYAFAALRADGSVVTWGDSRQGGDSSGVADSLDGTNDAQDAINIYSNQHAFAALRADGSVVTWGDSRQGGDSRSVATALNGTNDAQDVVSIYSNFSAFAALRADGSVVTWGYSTSGGDSSSVATALNGVNDAQDVVRLYSTAGAFAALRADGSVVTWGNSTSGGDSSSVATALDGTNDAQDVVSIYSNFSAFAALRSDGSVVTWGKSLSGGDSSSVATALSGTNDEQDVVNIYSTGDAFAALRADGSVVTWGYSTSGGDSSSVATALNGVNDAQDVVRLYSNDYAFAALRADGSVVTWGGYGGDSSNVATALNGVNDAQDVVRLYSNDYAFAALRADGSVVTWGYSPSGGDSSSVATALNGTNDAQDVVNIYSTKTAFAALRADGSVVTWGGSTWGGDSSSVATALNGVNDVQDVVSIYSTRSAFAALKADGSVVTWGYSLEGGDSSYVANQLNGTIKVTQIYATDFAFAAVRADGSVVTWGNADSGGYTGFAEPITNVASFANIYTDDWFTADTAPTATNLNTAENYTEDTALNLTDIVVSDVAGDNITAKLTLSDLNVGLLNSVSGGSYNRLTGEWTITGSVAAVNTAVADLTFHPAANFNGNFSVSTFVSDGQTQPLLGSKSFSGVAVNDAPTFAKGDGIVTTDLSSFDDVGYSVRVQTDGKILVAGRSNNGSNSDIALVRYNSDGSLDTSFDIDGKVATDLGAWEGAKSISILADGKVLVAGYSGGIALARYNPDGSLDSSFGDNGIVDSGLGNDRANATIQIDGKILVVGSIYDNTTGWSFLVARYNDNGSLDSSFGNDGKVITAFSGFTQAVANSVIVQTDGKILVAGVASGGVSGSDYAVVRYNSDGSLDSSFGNDGKVTTNVNNSVDTDARTMTLQADGKILVAGAGTGGFSIVRYNSDGSLDTSFDNDGIAIINFSPRDGSITVQNDGKILLAGLYNNDFALVRYNSNGSLDASFGISGKVTTDIGSYEDYGYSVTVQADGKILVAGVSYDSDVFGSRKGDFALVRYNSDGSLDTTFDAQNTLGGTINYTENAPAVVLNSNVNISDIELDAANNYNGASITLARHDGANSQDVFTGSGTLSLSNNAAVLNGITVGSYTQSNGQLVITFNNNATAAAVDSVLQKIAYSNTSDNPPASVQIDWTFNDGNTGAQGTGGALNATGSTTVNITAVNDAPTGTATAVLASGTEDTTYNITEESLLAGFSDVDGDSLSVADLTATNGTLTAVAGGWTFTPNADYNGAVNLNYNVIDGNGGSVAAAQSFELAAENDAPTFFAGGKVISAIGTFDDIGNDVVIQNDGKIVVSGSTYTLTAGSRESGNWSTSSDAVLVRYNIDGSLDTGFDSDGKLISSSGSGLGSFTAIQPDGKILVTGSSTLSRYHNDGTLDLTFDNDGSVSTDINAAFATSVQSDGKILIAGEIFVNGEGAFALARYHANGSLDTSFGNDGQVITTGTSIIHWAGEKHGDMTIQSDGKILVTGAYYTEGKTDFLLVRYDTNGNLDSSFGTNGKVFTSFGTASSYAYDVTVQNDGKILVTGGYDNHLTLVRYDNNGVLDSSFDVDGKVTTSIGSYDIGQSVKVQDDGKILVAGYSIYNNTRVFTLARYESNGTLDSSFDSDGIVTTNIIDAGFEHLSVSFTTQADGKILLVGSTLNTSNNYDIALVRYNPDGSLDTTFDAQDTLGGTANYTENAPTVVLDSNVNISDIELDAANNYNGASITLARHDGANSEDVFSGSSSLTLNNNTAVLDGITVGSYTQTNGELVITFNNNASSAAVDSVLQQIAYRNTSDNPPASVQINWTFNDGNTGAQGAGGALNATGSTTVNITAVNDAPTGTATAELANGTEDTAYNITQESLLAGFSDVDGDNLSVANLTATNGTLTAIAGGWAFTPNANYNGAVNLNYNVIDGNGSSVAAAQSFELALNDDAPTFLSGSGIVITPDTGTISHSTNRYTSATATLQNDGRILVAGTNNNDLILVSYNSNGTLDNNFSGDGKVITDFGSSYDFSNSVIVLNDGKILVVGNTNNGSNNDFALIRYNSDGSVDTNFGNSGRIVTDFGTSNETAYSVIQQTDGKIIVVGNKQNANNANLFDCALVRYNYDGTLDNSFDNDGKVITEIMGHSPGNSTTIQSDGKILVAGSAYNSFSLVRYNSDGSLDNGFDGDGKVITTFDTGAALGSSVAIQPDGKILVAGQSFSGSWEFGWDFALVRYNTDGSLDSSFDGDGKVTTNFNGSSNDTANAIAIQSDGKILLAGYSYANGEPWGITLLRYNNDGSLDTSFGNEGKVKTFLTLDVNLAYSVVVQSDGKILVTGVTSDASDREDFVLVRYNSDGSLDTSFGGQTTLGNTVNYTENAPAVVLDSNVNIIDLELDAANNYNGASITLARHDGANSEDVFSGSGTLTLSNNTTVLNGITVGSYTQNNGELVITFNNNATSAAVDSVLQKITYSNTSDNPPASVQIDWIFNDGNTGAQGTGSALNATGSTIVNITSVNYAPTNLSISTSSINENVVAGSVIGTLSSTDPDTGNTFTYSLVTGTGSTDNSAFSIVGNQLKINSSPDFETKSSYNVLIRTTDQDGLFFDKALTIKINNVIVGTANADTLVGTNSNDIINGLAGADKMTGGLGNDTYIVDNVGDVAIETSTLATEIDNVISSVSYTLGTNVENLTLMGTGAINGTGNGLKNSLTGNDAANTLNGGLGADTLIGGLGNDIYIVDNVGDVVIDTSTLATEIDTVNSSVSYTLSANVERLTLTGTAAINGTGNDLDNILVGNLAANTINGGVGADKMIGGLGNDTYIVDNVGDVVTETSTLATEIDTVNSSVTYTLSANVERLILTGISVINGTGNSLNNTLTGNSAANTINGGVGADKMTGDLGNDTYIVDNVGDVAIETSTLATEIDNVISSVSYTLGTNVEDLTLIGTGAINGTGNGLKNSLTGNDAANTLNGGLGADTLIGGLGNDIYIVDNIDDVVIDTSTLATEIDTVNSSVSYTLSANVERLTLTGTAAINGTGNDLDNILVGNLAANTINGGVGADKMTGGLGNDTYIVDNVGDVVTETSTLATEIDNVISSVSYTLGTNVENLTLIGTGAINGMGNGLKNSLTGNDAANTLNGGLGVDTLIGGLGNDTYIVDNVGDVVIETSTLATEIDTVNSSVSYTLSTNLENLTLTGIVAISGTGNSLNNTLTGNSAANTLNGGLGADTLIGGLGNDIYIVDNIDDVVIDTSTLANEIDTVNSSVSYTLSANVERLTLTGTAAINGTGNDLSNILTGNIANNSLTGGNGADTLIGGLGKDIINLTETIAATDTVRVAVGDSLVSAYDLVSDFKLGTGVISTAGVDKLDLVGTRIAANTVAVNGIDAGIIHSHHISKGLISFDDVDAYVAPLTITAANLANVFTYLQANITGGNTVAFVAEGNTFVFQDGGSAADTLVELVGVVADSVNTTGLAANAVWIV